MTDQEKKRLKEGPEPPVLAGNTAQPTPQPIALSTPPAYGRLDQTLNQHNVQQVQGEMRGVSMPITAYPPPHSFLGLVIISLIICAVLNITSLGLGIPALILSSLSFRAKQRNQWKKAESYGRIAFYLTIVNWMYVLLVAFLAIGTFLGILTAIIATLDERDSRPD